jgi:hypothetical protein
MTAFRPSIVNFANISSIQFASVITTPFEAIHA